MRKRASGTADVREAIVMFGTYGMKVLILAFQRGAMERSCLPHNHPRDSVAYTGTHDTNTVAGWFETDDDEGKEGLFRYLVRRVETGVNWEVIRLAMTSVARTAGIQMQDVLGTGGATRMNTPGNAEGNWQWRLPDTDLPALADKMAELTACYGRDT